MLSFDFKNKVVAITGASHGIGQATALAFVRAGAKVALLDIEENQGFLEALKQQNASFIFTKGDIRDTQVQQVFFDAIQDEFGCLDVAFLNAGVEGAPGSFLESSKEAWTRTLDINLEALREGARLSLKAMLPQKQGAIILNASIAGLRGFAYSSAYVASKHAVVGLTKCLAMEYAAQGIQINAVCPGLIQTPMIDRFSGGDMEALAPMIARKAIGRIGQAKEVAQLVQYLSCPESAFIVGQAIAIDGGYTLG